jgi:hypothetical protein
MRTQRGHIKEVLSWLVRRAYRAVTAGFCSALAALAGTVQNIFFLSVPYFNSFIPIAQQNGQAAVLGRLSLGMVSLVQPDSYRKLGKIRDKNVQKDTRFDVSMQS